MAQIFLLQERAHVHHLLDEAPNVAFRVILVIKHSLLQFIPHRVREVFECHYNRTCVAAHLLVAVALVADKLYEVAVYKGFASEIEASEETKLLF